VTSKRIAAMAQRVAADPYFLGWILGEYTRSEGLTEEELAVKLGCSRETLLLLALCRRPRSTPSEFRADVEQIANRFGVDAATLAQLVRWGEVVARLRAGAAGDHGSLIAARDRDLPRDRPTNPARPGE